MRAGKATRAIRFGVSSAHPLEDAAQSALTGAKSTWSERPDLDLAEI
jgi:hypothetical protein